MTDFSVEDCRLYRNTYFMPIINCFSFAKSSRDGKCFKVPSDTLSASQFKSEA